MLEFLHLVHFLKTIGISSSIFESAVSILRTGAWLGSVALAEDTDGEDPEAGGSGFTVQSLGARFRM